MSEFIDSLAGYVSKPEKAAKPEFILLYGDAGSGKTYTAATASQIPDIGKILYLDIEGSTVGTLGTFDPEKIDIIRVDEMPVKNQVPFVKKVLAGLSTDTGPYGAVVIDTLDVFQDLLIDAADEKFSDGFEKWRFVKDETMGLANRLKRLPILSVLVMHSREETSDTGALLTRLRLSGAAKDILPGLPDTVVLLARGVTKEDKKVHTTAWFESSNRTVTKNRFQFPTKMIDPTLPRLWEFIDSKESN